MKNERIQGLINIGLKELEAEVYLQLLHEPGITGYRISKLLKKTKPTVYKILETLLAKGLVISNEVAKSQVFTALPIKQFLDHQENEFIKNKERVIKVLKNIKANPVKPGLYPLERIDQVYSKSVELITNAKRTIVLTCCQLHNTKIIDALNEATGRGIKVLIQTYPPKPDIQNCDFAMDENRSISFKDFTYNWLEIFVDGNEYLMSLLTKEGDNIYKAIWCNEPYLAIITYNSNVTSFFLTIVQDMLKKNIPSQEILDTVNTLVKSYYHGINTKGINELLEKYV